MNYVNPNPPQSSQTASPHKYPQGHFKEKPCRLCGKKFSPKAPSHLFCSQECADRAHDNAYLMRTYDIGIDDYERMLTTQCSKCAICGGEGFLMDSSRHKTKLVVDHSHSTGEVRGLLCHNCNRALGLLQEKPENFLNALNYLKVQRLS